MNVSPVTPDSSALPELIPGYEAISRLGAGGYGEVWKVLAPGGLCKAIKLVYGQFDEERAVRELKSLSYMKQVRHPFVLSIERVEVVNGRLAVVSELADSSLKNRFEECRSSGLCGIPRDELLNYMRDAADALDYLCQSHALQHLDVKPENLLIVGGRVKVADFGLLKELHEGSESLLNSLTPVYAPPEVFDGRPNLHSDQYSLAIVYQEMLTGVPPFSGRTTAQLAAQHLYGRPVLTKLPVADQPTIERALSKGPHQRFPSCRGLIDALSKIASQVPNATRTASATDTSPFDSLRSTISISPSAIKAAADPSQLPHDAVGGPLASAGQFFPPSSGMVGGGSAPCPGKIVNLPPVDPTNFQPWARPTLFIGLGGLGTQTLCQLQSRLRDRFGHRTSIPALQLLAVDTNRTALYESVGEDESSKLDASQVLALPLQSAHEYRDKSKQLLNWLSRRWLFNVPRSQLTESIRALGRLAYVDHAEIFWERIRLALATACDPHGVTASSAVTKLPFQSTAPRIFLVASSAGGTGSGMALDVAFGLRRLLSELNYSDEHLCVVLAHSTARRSSLRDVAIANSYACLRELYHFSRFPFVDSAPLGEASFSSAGQMLGLPNAYLTHLGDDLDDHQYAAETDNLAEFVYRGSVTPAAAFFDSCRRETPASGNSFEPTVRSFGLRTWGISQTGLPAPAIDALCRTFVEVWRGAPQATENFCPPKTTQTVLFRQARQVASSRDVEIHRLTRIRAEELGLTAEGVLEMIDGIVERSVGGDFSAWMREGITSHEALLSISDRPLSDTPITDMLEQRLNMLWVSIEPYLVQLTDTLGATLDKWIADLQDANPARVLGAHAACEWLNEHCRTLKQRTSEQSATVEAQLESLTKELESLGLDALFAPPAPSKAVRNDPSAQPPESKWTQCSNLMLQSILLRSASRLVGGVQGSLSQLTGQLIDLRRDLSQLAEQFPTSAPSADDTQTNPWYDSCRELAHVLGERLTDVLGDMEQNLDSELFNKAPGLRRSLSLDRNTCGKLPSALRVAARAAVLSVQKEARRSFDGQLGPSASSNQANSLRSVAREVQPRWLACGGGLRRLVMLPRAAQPEDLSAECEQTLGGPCTLMHDADEEPLVCYEVEQIPQREIANVLTEGRAEIRQIGQRLHTRNDIQWSDLS